MLTSPKSARLETDVGARNYKFFVRINFRDVSPFDVKRRGELEASNPFMDLVRRQSVPPFGGLRDLHAAVSTPPGKRNGVVFQTAYGDVLAMDMLDALTRISVFSQVPGVNFLQLDQYRQQYDSVVESHIWSSGSLRFANYERQQFCHIEQNTDLYHMFTSFLRRQ